MGKRSKGMAKEKLMRTCYYVMKILGWEAPYSFSLSPNERIVPELYWEHVLLKIKGKFILPEKLTGQDLILSFIGNREQSVYLNDPAAFPVAEAKAIGAITVRGKQREYLGSLPIDMFPFVTNMLVAQKYNYIIMTGELLYRGRARIQSVDFVQEFVKEDWE